MSNASLLSSGGGGGGSGTVTDVSVVTANGVSGSVANSTTTPAITLTLGAITPSSVAAVGTVTGSNLSGTNTGDQNLFSTISVSGQSDVVADSTSDTLTLVAGSNITITTNAGTDTITITASGGGGGATWTEVEIDFGNTPQWSKTFTIIDAGSDAGFKIMCVPSGRVATGRVGNDQEWDNLLLAADPSSGQFDLSAIAVPGPIVGKRNILYSIAT